MCCRIHRETCRGAAAALLVLGLTLVFASGRARAEALPSPRVDGEASVQLRPAEITSASAGAMRARFDRLPASKDLLANTKTLPQWKICDPCKRSRRWELKLGPYGWLAGVSGTSYVDGESRDFDITFEDLTEVISGGFMFYAEFQMDRWFVAFDGTWATLQKDFAWRLGTFGFKVEQKIIELRGGYRLIGSPHGKRCDCKKSCCPPPRRDRFGLDVYAGARYWNTDTTLRLGIGPLGTERSSSTSWVDPIVGVRMGYQLAPNWIVGYRVDVGGFGIGDASKFAYRSFLGLDWKFANRWSLALGYQVMGSDRVEGSGAGRNGNDLAQHGPLIGVLFEL